jgi:hypothetical protein
MVLKSLHPEKKSAVFLVGRYLGTQPHSDCWNLDLWCLKKVPKNVEKRLFPFQFVN